MNVRVHVQYESPSESDRASLASLGRDLTNDRESVRVFARDAAPQWLVVEFTMPTEAQYKAVETIHSAIRRHAGNRMDSTIEFPKSAADQERSQRKAERRRARRRLRDAD